MSLNFSSESGARNGREEKSAERDGREGEREVHTSELLSKQ